MRKFLPLIALLPGKSLAESFQPPLPEVQTATAEFSYALASLGFIVVLACAQALVRRR